MARDAEAAILRPAGVDAARPVRRAVAAAIGRRRGPHVGVGVAGGGAGEGANEGVHGQGFSFILVSIRSGVGTGYASAVPTCRHCLQLSGPAGGLPLSVTLCRRKRHPISVGRPSTCRCKRTRFLYSLLLPDLLDSKMTEAEIRMNGLLGSSATAPAKVMYRVEVSERHKAWDSARRCTTSAP